MCTAVALPFADLPDEPLPFELASRVHTRGDGTREVRFKWIDPMPLLPVRWRGRVRLIEWGNRASASKLPKTGWTWQATIDGGGWLGLDVEPAEVVCSHGYEKGVWFAVRQGIHALVAVDEQEKPHVYVVCAPANRYYQAMTKCERMPVLVEQVIGETPPHPTD
jgi:hypothetical protein